MRAEPKQLVCASGKALTTPLMLPVLELTAGGLPTLHSLPTAAWTPRPTTACTKTQGHLQAGLAALALESSWHSKGKQTAIYLTYNVQFQRRLLWGLAYCTEIALKCPTWLPHLLRETQQLWMESRAQDDTRKGPFLSSTREITQPFL